MAIDIRATVTCSLGTLISGSISDDYLQGTGLIKCKGSVEISGTITPAIGTAVTFSYTKGGVTRSIPRKLRVLSSFADPFRRTTKVELGCKLTYLSDLKEPINWTALDDPENAAYSQADTNIITVPIHAKSVMAQCLSKLGLTATSNPLTNQFSVAKFDFGPGYVQVLSNLLVSESYCGFLNASEVLQVVELTEGGGTGPVIDSSKIIDVGPIGVGQLPGEAVTVSYSTLRLKQDNNGAVSTSFADSRWETNATSNSYSLPISYSNNAGNQAVATYNILETYSVTSYYADIKKSDGETVRVVDSRFTIETTGSAAVAGALVSEYLSNGLDFQSVQVTKITQEKYTYDQDGNETFYERLVSGSSPFLLGSAGVPFVLGSNDFVALNYSTIFDIEKEIKQTIIAGNFKQIETLLFGAWGRTIAGQQSIAASRDSFTSSTQVSNYLELAYNTTATGLQLIDRRVSTESLSAAQTGPDASVVINAANAASSGSSSNGYRTESKASLALAIGSATAQRRIELSLPYAPDDTFYKSGGSYFAKRSDAIAKANRFGRVQNKLLMGNRNGMNLQLAPEVLPSAPFAPFVVQANGLSALYRNNGTSWTMDANGVVVSTDALFWGAVGGTGTFWFPVAPGITSLPSTPPVVDGQMTVSSVVPVWNETVLADATTRLTLTVSSLNYPLELLTVVPAIRTKTSITATAIRKVAVGSTAIAMAPLAPSLAINTVVQVPVSTTSVAAIAPVVGATAVVNVPTASLTLEALVPSQAGTAATAINVPNTDVAMAVALPAVITGVSIAVPAVDLSVNALVPEVGGNLGEAFGLTALLADDLLDLDF